MTASGLVDRDLGDLDPTAGPANHLLSALCQVTLLPSASLCYMSFEID